MPSPRRSQRPAPVTDREPDELASYRREFSAAPSFALLRKLAELWSRTEHWELAAQAYLHVALARPTDAQALADAARAVERSSRPELAERLWERAYQLRPDNQEFAEARARARRSEPGTSPQANSSVDRTGF